MRKIEGKFNSVLNYIEMNDLDLLMEYLEGANAYVDVLTGAGILDKKTMLEEMSVTLFNGIQVTNWAQLEDLLWVKILDMKFEEYCLVWTEVHKMLEGGLEDLVTVLNIFLDIARRSLQHGHQFRIFLVGHGSNFKNNAFTKQPFTNPK